MKLLENMHAILSLILSKMYNEVSPGGIYLESSTLEGEEERLLWVWVQPG